MAITQPSSLLYLQSLQPQMLAVTCLNLYFIIYIVMTVFFILHWLRILFIVKGNIQAIIRLATFHCLYYINMTFEYNVKAEVESSYTVCCTRMKQQYRTAAFLCYLEAGNQTPSPIKSLPFIPLARKIYEMRQKKICSDNLSQKIQFLFENVILNRFCIFSLCNGESYTVVSFSESILFSV